MKIQYQRKVLPNVNTILYRIPLLNKMEVAWSQIDYLWLLSWLVTCEIRHYVFQTQDSNRCINKVPDDSDGCSPWLAEMWFWFKSKWHRIIWLPFLPLNDTIYSLKVPVCLIQIRNFNTWCFLWTHFLMSRFFHNILFIFLLMCMINLVIVLNICACNWPITLRIQGEGYDSDRCGRFGRDLRQNHTVSILLYRCF